jgi:4-amino-4-deoxy-L-arabinose transferase-like glycosyltransferase
MPPCLWTAVAVILSASTGAVIARAIGRAYRASSLPPPAIRRGLYSERGLPADARPATRVVAQADSGTANAHVMAEAGQPVRLTAQGAGSDRGSDEMPTRFRGRARTAIDSWVAALGRVPLWRSLSLTSPSTSLAVAAAALYVITRLWAIGSFPVFFYSDEVNYVLFGEQTYQRGLVGSDGSWPAVYVPWDDNRWGPALGMYLEGLTSLLFGRHIWVARATEALLTLGGVLAIAWILKDHFRSRFWWASILLAAIIPAWFLYSRTAFSVAAGASFYAVFLLAYLHYRFRSPTSLGLAVVAGAAAFYSYSNMMLLMGTLVACLLISDIRYHLLHRRAWLRALPILVLVAIPFLEFRILHPEAIRANLSALGSYWLGDLSLAAKLLRYAQTYLHGLSPIYWFAPEAGTGTLPVQFIPYAGHLGFAMLPLVGIGLVVVLRNLRSSLYRLVLLSALVVPVGSALDTIEIYRVLAMVVPALLLAGIGLEQLGAWFKSIPQTVQTAAVGVILLVLALARMVGAVTYGPTWAADNGLEGAQFGAKVLYEDVIPSLLAEEPETTLVMTTTWANNSHIYPIFFLSPAERERVHFGNIRDYLVKILPLEPGLIIVMTPAEYADAAASPMLGELDVVKIVDFPNGEPGFYFAHIAYAADAEHVLQEQEALRRVLVEDQVDILGQPTIVAHSRLGDGQIANLFDGSVATLVRGDRVNPLKVEIHFTEPISLRGLAVTVGSIQDFTLTLRVTTPTSTVPMTTSERFKNAGPDPTVSLQLPAAEARASVVSLEITDNTQGSEAMIHVREIVFR